MNTVDIGVMLEPSLNKMNESEVGIPVEAVLDNRQS